MNSCIQMEELLNAYIDNEVNISEKEIVEKHLSSCIVCRQNLEELQYTKKALSGLKPQQAPTELWGKITKQLSSHVEDRQNNVVYLYRKTGKRLAAAAAILFFFLSSIVLLGYFSPDPLSNKESSMYVGSHAYHLMRQPLADHSSWSLVAGESDLEILGEE